MTFTTLVSALELARHLDDPDWVIVDCRFALQDPAQKEAEYRQSHIPGAVYAHLDRDLSAPVIPGVTGRHPLPDVEGAARTFSSMGIAAGVQVVAYDDLGGALAAARLWWMLRWLGHSAAAVLDGGWGRWSREGYPTRGGVESRQPVPAKPGSRTFIPHPRPELVVGAAEVASWSRQIRDESRRSRDRLGDPAYRLFDVRTPERYRGEVEPIDPVAGHIPGALNLPYPDNLDPSGRFRPPEELRALYLSRLGGLPAERAAFYCGSGVTAAQGVLALAYAGLGEARLYAGSWSEWITDPQRPVAVGGKM